ncbi:MAG: cytochrome c1 [Methylicorpusculum sp.]|uniref:cytochrome c1 n=1 Tax=Methylicorpusculum sp. TaxID=2713644 RepID=UPI00271F6CFB|nr:cytochrome c1 [Methylicorpusculum sp.]MDO8843007.1 cytochrome c1 [Methylicorpusculum sp.]MDO8939683.1 cytochrome c1 [Methylicorpusculum sp.]MDO9239211.1 cytochrome c1 [Methylicorpusculum sp.]MDP2178746.1 cytochrome c1 [Methylicorpusculum sp.]MDP2202875.1 cytochrome c1 [Methylicorpusculum sp.]
MNKLLTLFLIFMLPFTVLASEGLQLQKADIDLTNNASLERGAKHFVTYCLGCHSAKHIRYLRIAIDFDLKEDKVLKEIAPLGANIYDKMTSAMNAHDAEKWFGIMPPDLSLIARSRGEDWIYSYLKGFYTDKSKPLGVNNTVFPDVGMPNVLWQLQGEQTPIYKNVDGREVIEKLSIKEAGQLSEKEFDVMINDLTNFLVYVGEPVKLERERMGKYVLFFIFMIFILSYLLKKEYWKDLH